jgi:hypothetical protein
MGWARYPRGRLVSDPPQNSPVILDAMPGNGVSPVDADEAQLAIDFANTVAHIAPDQCLIPMARVKLKTVHSVCDVQYFTTQTGSKA